MTEQIPLEIDVGDVKDLRESDTPHLIIDCREHHEFEFCRIEGTLLIPMGETPSKVESIADHRQEPIIVLCHLGMRSLTVVNWLRQNGFPTAQSMSGGIDAWSAKIDPAVPRY